MSAPTRAGRALRRSLLKGCVVVIVVAGYSGKRFVYERAHELGIRCSPRSLVTAMDWKRAAVSALTDRSDVECHSRLALPGWLLSMRAGASMC